MKKLLLILACSMVVPALAHAQASGSFSYGTAGAYGVNGGVVGCVLDTHGTITGGDGNNVCGSSSTGVCPVQTGPGCNTSADCLAPYNTCVSGTCEVSCTPGSAGNTACSTAVGSGSICTSGSFCSSTSCQFFTCASNNDCLDIYGLNSGATCVNAVCQLPSFAGTCMGSASAGIKTNSGSGNVFDIRTSAVIGLLTDVTVTSKQQTAAANNIALSAALAG